MAAMAGKPLANRDMTTNERRALQHYVECYERDGDAPTTAALARHLQVSHNAAKWLLQRLELKGYLAKRVEKITVTRLKPTKKKLP